MSAEIMHGDCLTVLPTLPAKSVQTCVTSPPYWGLRDYGTAKWDGGDNACDHRSGIVPTSATDPGIRRSTLEGGKRTITAQSETRTYRDLCGRCGATRIDAQLGLERTPDEYVATMVDVFRAVRRVLRDDGTLWLNLGDSYAGNGTNRNGLGNSVIGSGPNGACKQRDIAGSVRSSVPFGLKVKDLVGIPWRVAFALQADGWYLRSDIIWHKPNPMPESVSDRPTKAHEYLFLLTKSASYYYDADAIKEPTVRPDDASLATTRNGVCTGKEWAGSTRVFGTDPRSRNRRSVWTVATRPYKGAHFATFPPALIEPCILAGSREGDVVLDPFGGSGTTAAVATRHNRNAISIELNAAYLALQYERLATVQPALGIA